MAKKDIGIKRICLECEAKFYDLNRSPILCPKCGTEFVTNISEVVKVPPATSTEDSEDIDTDLSEDGPEIISLEEADLEMDNEDDDIDAVADVDLGDDEVDDLSNEDEFLEDEDEGANDVSDLIRGPAVKDDDL